MSKATLEAMKVMENLRTEFKKFMGYEHPCNANEVLRRWQRFSKHELELATYLFVCGGTMKGYAEEYKYSYEHVRELKRKILIHSMRPLPMD